MGIIRRILFVFLSLLILPLMFGPIGSIAAQSPSGTEWFCEETGLTVRGEFLTYYHSTENYLELFGYPITQETTDAMGHRVQYFQKARLDFDEISGTVHSAPLGTYLYNEGEYEVADFNSSGSLCRMFPNGKTVCYAFLQFYDLKNGENYLGLPISNTEYNEQGYLTQFFEKGVLVWYPREGTGRKVQMMDLGRIYFDRFVGDPSLKKPDFGSFGINQVQLVPQVDVFTSKAIVSANSTEEIFVIVKDQYQRPLANANVTITITLPDGSENSFRPQNTNADGITTLEIMIGSLEPRDVVQINAVVTLNYQQEATTGSTWFRVWW